MADLRPPEPPFGMAIVQSIKTTYYPQQKACETLGVRPQVSKQSADLTCRYIYISFFVSFFCLYSLSFNLSFSFFLLCCCCENDTVILKPV